MSLNKDFSFFKHPVNEILYKNVKNVQQSSISLQPNDLVIKPKLNFETDYLNINLHKTVLQNKHINSIKLQFVSKKIDDKPILTQEYIDSNLINLKYNVKSGRHYLIVDDDDFYQNTNLLTPGLILPIKHINCEGFVPVCINISNISNVLSLLNDLDLQISYDEVEFEEEFDRLMTTVQIMQTKNNTYNVFRVMGGFGVKAFEKDLPIDIYSESILKMGLAGENLRI